MEGRDMVGRAITGSGKTLAFGIPILDNIIRHRSQHRFISALIINLLLLEDIIFHMYLFMLVSEHMA